MKAVAAQEPLATLPPFTSQLLKKLGAAYQPRTSTSDELPASQYAQSIMLADDIGPLQVIFPRDTLLDLSRLAELTGRQLSVMNPERLTKALERSSLETLPGLPVSTSTPCLYDTALQNQPSVWIDSGRRGLKLELSADEFHSMMEKSSSGQLGIPLSEIRPNLTQPQADVDNITRAVESFSARRIRQRLEETIEIPPLPQSANRIIRLRTDQNATVGDLAAIVETDPALAAQVISWASSPYYTAVGRITSVEDAINRALGFELVINLALGLALGKTLSLPKEEEQLMTAYWKQAIYTATLVDGLSRIIPAGQRPDTGLAYLGGLLHSFGFLVMAHVFPPQFSLLCRHLAANPHIHSSLVEQHLLGVTREQMGSWLMQHWELPDEIITALRFQHVPDYRGPYCEYPQLINLASYLLTQRGLSHSSLSAPPPELFESLGIELPQAEKALDRLQNAEQALRELAEQMSPA